MDSFIGRMISTTAAVLVSDAETVVVGMQPAVAITLVELGLTLEGVRTALDVDRGMAILSRRLDGAATRPTSHADVADLADLADLGD